MSPLAKRHLRQLKNNWSRYLALFLLLVLFVSICSGFKAAVTSCQKIVGSVRDTYTVEDGRFTSNFELSNNVISRVEDKGVSLNELFSLTANTTFSSGNKEADFRVFKNRENVDKVVIHEGTLASESNEIALDVSFAHNNDINVGDVIAIQGLKFTVVGLISLPDAQMLFKDNSDMMGNSVSFGIGCVSKDGFASIKNSGATVSYTYSFVCDDRQLSDSKRFDLESEISDLLADEKVTLSSFIDSSMNNGINFATSDFEGDSSIVGVLTVLVIALLSFIFAVLNSSAIDSESAVIGTLLASGYRKSELLRHYMSLPVLIGIVAVILGNIVGYLFVIDYTAGLYYSSYSLPPFYATFDWDAFVETSIGPLLLLVFITFIGLVRKLRLTPLQFLRHDLKKHRKASKINLPENLPFTTRFRLRVILQNRGNFITLFFGITFASLLLIFGFCIIPTMDNYSDDLKTSMPAEHIYTLKSEVNLDGKQEEREAWSALMELRENVDMTRANEEDIANMARQYYISHFGHAELLGIETPEQFDTLKPSDLGFDDSVYGNMTISHLVDLIEKSSRIDTSDENAIPVNSYELSKDALDQAEKIAVTTLKIPRRYSDSEEEVTVYGIQPNSKYWQNLSVNNLSENEIVCGPGLLDKCFVEKGVVFGANAEFTSDEYDLIPVDTWGGSTNTNIYMSIEQYRRIFGENEGYFNGYVSNEDLHIDKEYLARDMTPADMESVAIQMNQVMSRVVGIIVFLALVIYLIAMFLLTKIIVDKSARSISYMKIFGYRPKEISKLYISSITTTVVASLLISMPIIIFVVSWIMKLAMARYSGNLITMVPSIELIKVFLLGIFSYALVVILDLRHIRKVPMAMALKVQE